MTVTPYNYLKDHAIKNIWCNKFQDNQRILCAQKIVYKYGVINNFSLMGRNCKLPTSNDVFYVYQIGQIYPDILGLLRLYPVWRYEQWFNFKDVINSSELFVDIYNTLGVQHPRFDAYYMFTNEKNLIIAIKKNSNIDIDYHDSKIYLRLYTNAFYDLNAANNVTPVIYTNGIKITSVANILSFENELNIYRNKTGSVFCYKNGFLVHNLSLLNISVGDTVEFIYDSSVKGEVTFTIKDLYTFHSILDLKIKYLLHYSNIFTFKEIEYHDDIDIYILDSDNQATYKGVYYHRNSADAVRMLTHKDYSLVSEYVSQYCLYLNQKFHNGNSDILDFKIHLRIRNSGYDRNLTYNNNRIHELYKLPDDKIVQAMVGLNSCVDVWKAENLEKSSYCKVMRLNDDDITISDIENCYGYNAASYYLANTPQIPFFNSGTWNVNLEYNQITNSTMYEHNSDGLLIWTQQHLTNGTNYTCGNINTRLVETYVGLGQYDTKCKFGSDNIDISDFEGYEIKVYMCHYFNNVPDNNWTDITDTSNYSISNNILKWENSNIDTQFLMIRSDKYFLSYEFELGITAGNLYFTLSELEDRYNAGVNNNYVLPVPLGDLDIWLNGHSLIRGLDYIINFPTIYIITKEFFVHPLDTSMQKINVRFHGFSDSKLTMDSIEDYGFIKYGLISENHRFNIRDDKVVRITVGGCLLTKNDFLFSEDSTSYNPISSYNGRPYSVKDIYVPMKGITETKTTEFRNKSIIIDRAIEDYMTKYLPENNRTGISSIPYKYNIFSPFLSHIILDLRDNIISDSNLKVNMTKLEIINICKSYENNLMYDPISNNININLDYVLIHPHILNNVINLSYLKYKFLLKVVEVYANGRINNLNSFITFSI